MQRVHDELQELADRQASVLTQLNFTMAFMDLAVAVQTRRRQRERVCAWSLPPHQRLFCDQDTAAVLALVDGRLERVRERLQSAQRILETDAEGPPLAV